MNGCIRLPVRFLLALYAVAVLCGCSAGPDLMGRVGWLGRDDPEDAIRYGPPPKQQVRQLQDLAASSGGLDMAARQRVSGDLVFRLGRESDPLIRVEIVRALGAFVTPGTIAGLRTAMDDSDPTVRVAACQVWAQCGGPEAIGVLAERLGSDTDVDVRLAATQALGAFSDPAAYRALTIALDDSDPALQYRAIDSLRRSSGREFGNDIASWRQFAQGGNPPPVPKPSFAERLRMRF